MIARVLGGDRLAARELYDTHAPRVYRLIFRLVRDEALAEELTQDALVKVFGALAGFRGDARLSTWVHRVAAMEGLSALRRRKRRADRELDLELVTEVAAPDVRADPDLAVQLRQAIDALPDVYRMAVVLHDIEGFTHAEIAELTGSPEGTCKTRLMHGRAKLRQALAAFAP